MPSLKRKNPLLIAFITIFLDLVGFGIIIPIQPFYAESFGATPTVVTLLGASYSFMQFVFTPVWGRLSDRVGRRPIILVSVAVNAIANLIFGLAGNLFVLFGARILAGFGNANIGTAQALIADSTTREDRARGMGIIGAAFGLGFIFGPAIGGFLSRYGPEAPAFAAAGLSAMNFVMALFLLPETLKRDEQGTPQPAESRRRTMLSFDRLRRARAFENVPQLLVVFLVITTGFALMEQALPLFIERVWVLDGGLGSGLLAQKPTAAQLQQGAQMTGWLLVSIGITAAIVQGRLIGPLSRRFGERRLIWVGMLLMAAGLAVIPAIGAYGQYWHLHLGGILLAAGTGLTTPSLNSLLSQSVPADQQGTYLGQGQSLSALGRVVGPSVAGLLFELSISIPFFAGAILIGLAFLTALTIRKPKTA